MDVHSSLHSFIAVLVLFISTGEMSFLVRQLLHVMMNEFVLALVWYGMVWYGIVWYGIVGLSRFNVPINTL